MKYRANPVEVTAYEILRVEYIPGAPVTSYKLIIGDPDPSSENQSVIATPEMCSRMRPTIGDFWVIQSDGYVYLNPRDVFRRKYSPILEGALGNSAENQVSLGLGDS